MFLMSFSFSIFRFFTLCNIGEVCLGRQLWSKQQLPLCPEIILVSCQMMLQVANESGINLRLFFVAITSTDVIKSL